MKEKLELRWTTQAQFALRATNKDRILYVGVQPGASGDWTVLAVQSSQDGNLEAILDNHAHELLGTFKSVAAAVKAAESYAKSWWKKKTLTDKCDCGPIGISKPKRGK